MCDQKLIPPPPRSLPKEAAWCLRVLPPQQPQLVAALCRATLAKVSQGIRDKLMGGGSTLRGGVGTSIAALMGLQKELAGLAGCVEGVLKASDPQVWREVWMHTHTWRCTGGEGTDLVSVPRSDLPSRAFSLPPSCAPSLQLPQVRRESLRLVYGTLEDKVASYGELERAQLASELAGCPLPSGPATCAEDLAPQMVAAAKAAFSVLGQAVPRCLGFTGEWRGIIRATPEEITRDQSHSSLSHHRRRISVITLHVMSMMTHLTLEHPPASPSGGTELRSLLRATDHELSSVLGKLQAAVSALHTR